jgi:hypothetical protein
MTRPRSRRYRRSREVEPQRDVTPGFELTATQAGPPFRLAKPCIMTTAGRRSLGREPSGMNNARLLPVRQR